MRGGKGRSASRLFRDGISGRRGGSGDRGGVAGWKRGRRPDRRDFQAAFHLPRGSATRGIAPPARAAPHLPLPARPAAAALSPPSPRSQSFRLRICTCGGPSSDSPTPDPSAPRCGDWEGPRRAGAPGAGEPGAGQRGALTCRRFGSGCLPGCDLLGAGRRRRGDLRGFRADRPGASCAPLRVRSQPPARVLPGSCKRKERD